MTTYVLDTTLLLHAGRADRLNVLETIVPPGRHVVTDVVEAELTGHGILSPSWVEVDAPGDHAYLTAFAQWSQRMGVQESHHRGESSVCALAETMTDHAVVVIDDSAARRTAQSYGVDAHGILWLLSRSVHTGHATAKTVSGFCDILLGTGIRWPISTGGFERWAGDAGLL